MHSIKRHGQVTNLGFNMPVLFGGEQKKAFVIIGTTVCFLGEARSFGHVFRKLLDTRCSLPDLFSWRNRSFSSSYLQNSRRPLKQL